VPRMQKSKHAEQVKPVAVIDRHIAEHPDAVVITVAISGADAA
jgi:hypothetical protein